jgi:hypothetical protein
MASVFIDLPLRSVGSITAPGIASEATLQALLTELELKADLTETQPVSGSFTITGSATEAKQDDQITLATTLNAKDFATQTTLAALLAELMLKADLLETQPVSVAGTVAVSGALTDTQLRATPVSTTANAGTNLNTSALNLEATQAQIKAKTDNLDVLLSTRATNADLLLMSAKLPASLGQKTMAASMSVALASDQTAIPVSQTGKAKVAQLFNDYSLTSVTAAAYVELTASTASAVNTIEIFDSSGQALILAVGAAASEVDQLYIFPGGNGKIELAIPASSRISIKAKTATASVGFIAINLYS